MRTHLFYPGDDLPEWLVGFARESAEQYLQDDEDTIVVAVRQDGNVQVIPETIDPEVLAELLKWAAGA